MPKKSRPSRVLLSMPCLQRHDVGDLFAVVLVVSCRLGDQYRCGKLRRIRTGPAGLSGRAGAGGDLGAAAPAAAAAVRLVRWHLFLWPVARAVEEVAHSLRDGGLGDLIALVAQVAGFVVPGEFTEGGGSGRQQPPGNADPPAFAVVAQPKEADVVGVVADLPPVLPPGDPRLHPTQPVQFVAVVGTVADLDAVGVDRLPAGGQQL
ncbi:hypothetical protein ACFVT6_02520 [Streptomyces sp. NPDC058049]|uniref:hypothetical protein n=1 Tax=Streptomyces sp. NPDC058049 TaxID=3346314 RepID=UPI0036EB502E